MSGDKLARFVAMMEHKPKRTRFARELHCVLCGAPIRTGDEYRDGGYPRRAHEACYQTALAAVAFLRAGS